MFNMQGMNFIDLAKLKVGQIIGGRVRYIRSKTNKPYEVKLTKEAQEIVSNYILNKKPDDYIFPILNKAISSIFNVNKPIYWEIKMSKFKVC